MRARRVDGNLDALVKAARKCGMLVHITNGDWDLTVQLAGKTEIWEVKDPSKPPSRRRLTVLQEALRKRGWKIRLVQTLDDVLTAKKEMQHGYDRT